MAFERLDESVQLLCPCLSALDGRGGFFVCFLRLVVPAGEVIVAFLVGALVLGDAGVFGDALFREACEQFHVGFVLGSRLFELVRLAERLLQVADVFDDFLLACDELVHGAEEDLLDVGFGEVRRLAVVLEFVVAAVDGLAVFVGRVPDFRAVPAAAVAAFDFRRVDADAAVAVATVPAALHRFLHLVEDLGADDGFVVVLDVVLRHLSLVLPCFLREEVDGVAFLEERVAFVFLVREDAADRALAPVFAAAGRRDAPARELCRDGVERVAREEEAVDFFDRPGLLAVHDERAVRAFVVAEEPCIGDADLAVREALPLAPGRVLGNAAAFFLRERAHDGDEELAFRVERPDVFLLEINLDALVLELPHGGQAVDGVAGETADALRDDEVDLARERVLDHALETFTVARVRCADALVGVHSRELPVLAAFDVVRVVVDLRLVARHLVGVVGRDSGVARNAPPLRARKRRGRKPADGRGYRMDFPHDCSLRFLQRSFAASLILRRCSSVRRGMIFFGLTQVRETCRPSLKRNTSSSSA